MALVVINSGQKSEYPQGLDAVSALTCAPALELFRPRLPASQANNWLSEFEKRIATGRGSTVGNEAGENENARR